MKKIINILLCLAMLASILPASVFSAEEAVFTDMTGDEYYADSAQKLAESGIFTGYGDGSFGAKKSISRAEMTAILCRVAGKEAIAEELKGKTFFNDVSAEHWASGYINYASNEKIIVGYGNGSFLPENDVRVEEAVKMIICAFGHGEGIASDSTDWSKPYMDIAAARGITAGILGKKGEPAMRGDIAVMVDAGIIAAEDGSAVKEPVVSLAEGSYSKAQKVTLTAEEGDEIYYTLDGEEPTTASTKYTGEIAISKTATLKAIAVRGLLASKTVAVKYTIKRAYRRGGGGTSTPALTSAAMMSDGVMLEEGAVLSAGNVLTVSITSPSVTGYTVSWNIGGISVDSSSYTVTSFDAGKTIFATVKKDSTTVTTDSYSVEGKIEVDLAGTELTPGTIPSAPVVIEEAAVYVTADGALVELDAEADVEIDITATDCDAATDEMIYTATEVVNNEYLPMEAMPVYEEYIENNFTFKTIDVALNIAATEESEAVKIYPYGEIVLTLTAEQLGIELGEGEALSDYCIIGKEKMSRPQAAIIVTDEKGAEYVQFVFNALEEIYIGICRPFTVTFDTQGGTEIPAQKVAMGRLADMTAIEDPTKDGYIFRRWDYDLAVTYIMENITVTAEWVESVEPTEVPADRIYHPNSNANATVTKEQGGIVIRIAEDAAFGANQRIWMEIAAPIDAFGCAIGKTPEEALLAEADYHFTGRVVCEADVTDENGQVLLGRQDTYIKWVDGLGNVLSLESAFVKIEAETADEPEQGGGTTNPADDVDYAVLLKAAVDGIQGNIIKIMPEDGNVVTYEVSKNAVITNNFGDLTDDLDPENGDETKFGDNTFEALVEIAKSKDALHRVFKYKLEKYTITEIELMEATNPDAVIGVYDAETGTVSSIKIDSTSMIIDVIDAIEEDNWSYADNKTLEDMIDGDEYLVYGWGDGETAEVAIIVQEIRQQHSAVVDEIEFGINEEGLEGFFVTVIEDQERKTLFTELDVSYLRSGYSITYTLDGDGNIDDIFPL